MARTEINEVVLSSTTGKGITGAVVEIRDRSDDSLATIYAAETGMTTIANPTTSTRGRVDGWLDNGSYILIATDPSIDTLSTPFESLNGDFVLASLTTEAAARAAGDALSAQKSANLSDLVSASAARTNLGLGSAATHPTTDFDAAGVADSAVTAHSGDTTAVHGIDDTSKLAKFTGNVGDAAKAINASTGLPFVVSTTDSSMNPRGDFDPSVTDYEIGDVVDIQGGKLIARVSPIAAAANPDLTKWGIYNTDGALGVTGLGLQPRGGWMPDTDYLVRDLFTFGGIAFIVRNPFTSGSVFVQSADFEPFTLTGDSLLCRASRSTDLSIVASSVETDLISTSGDFLEGQIVQIVFDGYSTGPTVSEYATFTFRDVTASNKLIKSKITFVTGSVFNLTPAMILLYEIPSDGNRTIKATVTQSNAAANLVVYSAVPGGGDSPTQLSIFRT